MSRNVEQNGSLPVCLSVCVQRAALKTPPPFGRTLSFPGSALRLFEVRTPPPRQVWVPFRRSRPVAEGVGRDGTPSGQACTADSGHTRKKRSQTPCSTKSPSSAASDRTQRPRPLRTTASTSSSTSQPRRAGRTTRATMRPAPNASRLRLEQSLEVRQDSPERAAHHP